MILKFPALSTIRSRAKGHAKMKRLVIDVTTNSGGAGTGYSQSTLGLLYAVQLGVGTFSAGVDLVLTCENGFSIPLLTIANFNTSQILYPRVVENDATDGGEETTKTMPIVAGRILATIAQGGAVTSGTIVAYVLEGGLDLVRIESLDRARPTVLITSSESSPTAADPIPVTVTFSEAVTGFAVGDIVETNCTLSDFTAVSSLVYTVNAAPTAPGALTFDIPADICTDGGGNGNYAAPQFSITAS
jgi:hypothetical protein